MEREKVVEAKIKFWQNALNLSDWFIDFKLARIKEIYKRAGIGVSAYVVFSGEVKAATIHLPIDFEKETICGFCAYDFLIVHEMLHLILNKHRMFFQNAVSYAPKEAKGVLKKLFEKENEAAINALTKSLVRLKNWLIYLQAKQEKSG